MKFLRVLQWLILAALTLAFGIMISVVGRKASATTGGTPDYTAGWESIYGEEVETLTPEEAYESFLSASEEVTPEEIEQNSGFLISSSALMFVGTLGFVLMVTAVAVRRSGRLSFLTIGGSFALVFGGFWLFGFNLAYPGEFGLFDALPKSLGGPLVTEVFDEHATDMDSYYGMAVGYSIWTDFLFQAFFALTAAMMILGLSAGRYRTATLVVTASAVGTVGYSLTTSWHWGGGWLSSLEAYDFAGSGNIHVLGGSAAFALVLLSRMVPAQRPGQMKSGGHVQRPDRVRCLRVWEMVMYAVGLAIVLLLILGANAGSVLWADTNLITSVANASRAAVLAGFVTAGLISIPLARRSRVVVMGIGALAGWAAIAAPPDLVDPKTAAGIGAMAGALAALVAWAMDLNRFDDPLGVVPISLVGGVVGLLSAGLFAESVTMTAQVIMVLAIAIVGFGMALSVALVAWLLGWLWDDQGLAEPEEPGAGLPET